MSLELTSPLMEVGKESLSELFQRDPLDLSEQDLKKIVETLRGQRKLWQQTQDAPKAPRAKRDVGTKPSLSSAEMDALLDGIYAWTLHQKIWLRH